MAKTANPLALAHGAPRVAPASGLSTPGQQAPLQRETKEEEEKTKLRNPQASISPSAHLAL